MLLGRRGLCKQLQQREAVVKVHVLLDAILLAEGQEHVGPATCREGASRSRLGSALCRWRRKRRLLQGGQKFRPATKSTQAINYL